MTDLVYKIKIIEDFVSYLYYSSEKNKSIKAFLQENFKNSLDINSAFDEIIKNADPKLPCHTEEKAKSETEHLSYSISKVAHILATIMKEKFLDSKLQQPSFFSKILSRVGIGIQPKETKNEKLSNVDDEKKFQ